MTFWYPSWRSPKPLKGSRNHQKKVTKTGLPQWYKAASISSTNPCSALDKVFQGHPATYELGGMSKCTIFIYHENFWVGLMIQFECVSRWVTKKNTTLVTSWYCSIALRWTWHILSPQKPCGSPLKVVDISRVLPEFQVGPQLRHHGGHGHSHDSMEHPGCRRSSGKIWDFCTPFFWGGWNKYSTISITMAVFKLKSTRNENMIFNIYI